MILHGPLIKVLTSVDDRSLWSLLFLDGWVSVSRFDDALCAVHGLLRHANVSIPYSYIVCLLFITVIIVLRRFIPVLRAGREIILR